MELNGAELITEAVTVGAPDSSRYPLERFVVRSAYVDETLSSEDIRIEPERRNSNIWTWRADYSELREEYDESGTLIYSESETPCYTLLLRKSLVPVAAVGGLVTAIGVALVSRGNGRWRKKPTGAAEGARV